MKTKHLNWLSYNLVHNITAGLYLVVNSSNNSNSNSVFRLPTYVMNDYGFLVKVAR